MKLQDQIDSTDLDMTEAQVKAFLLGILCAEKPLPFPKALEELLSQTPEAKATLESPVRVVWSELQNNLTPELEKMLPNEPDLTTYLEITKDQLDFFLTGMALSGTDFDSCKNPAMAELLEELEDAIEDLFDYLSDSETTEEEGKEFRQFLTDTWKAFIKLKR